LADFQLSWKARRDLLAKAIDPGCGTARRASRKPADFIKMRPIRRAAVLGYPSLPISVTGSKRNRIAHPGSWFRKKPDEAKGTITTLDFVGREGEATAVSIFEGCYESITGERRCCGALSGRQWAFTSTRGTISVSQTLGRSRALTLSNLKFF